MPEKKTYFIYGDDERVQGENLDELASKVDGLMGIRKERILKEREKNKKKPKKNLNNGNFVSHVTAELRDVEAEEAGIRGGSDPFLNDIDNYTEVQEPEQKKRPKKKEKKERKKLKVWPIILAVLAVLLLLALLFGIFAPKVGLPGFADLLGSGSETQNEVVNTPAPTEDTEDYSVYVSEGFLSDIDVSREYDLEESVGYAKGINDITTKYLDDMIDVINRKKTDETVNVEKEIAINKAKIELDTTRLYAYENIFSTHHGNAYIKAAETRMENIRAMYNSVSNSMTLEELVEVVNGYIQSENTLSDNSKTELMDFLDFNGVEYQLVGDEIKYDSAQFRKTAEEGEETADEGLDLGNASFLIFEKRTDKAVESGKVHLSDEDRGVTDYSYLGLFDNDAEAQAASNALNDKLIGANNTALSYPEGSKLKYETQFGFMDTFEQFLQLDPMVALQDLKVTLEEMGYTCRYTN